MVGMYSMLMCYVQCTKVPEDEVHTVWLGWQISTVWPGTEERGWYKGGGVRSAQRCRTRASWVERSGEGDARERGSRNGIDPQRTEAFRSPRACPTISALPYSR